MPSDTPSQQAVDAAARRYRFDFLDWSGELGSPSGEAQIGLFGFRLNAPSNTDIPLNGPHGSVRGNSANYTKPHGICTCMRPEGDILVTDRGQTFLFPSRATHAAGNGTHDGDILAPMPGKVIAVDVAEGQQVEAGQRLLVLEAMKMEHALTAPFAGTVVELKANEGAQVQVEALLARVEPAED